MRTSTARAASSRESHGTDGSALDARSRSQRDGDTGRVGGSSTDDNRDDTEIWVIIAGDDETTARAVDKAQSPTTTVRLPASGKPAEHSGLVFASFYRCETDRVIRVASGVQRRHHEKRPIVVFSSLPAPSSRLHFGHLLEPFFAADVFVRHQRMIGASVWQGYAAKRKGTRPEQTDEHIRIKVLKMLMLMDIDVYQYADTLPNPPTMLSALFSGVAAPAVAASQKETTMSKTPAAEDRSVNKFSLLKGGGPADGHCHAIWGTDVVNPHSVDGIRFHLAYLALNRPDNRHADASPRTLKKLVQQTLIGTWQHWLNDLGARILARYDGIAPNTGVWTPEHTAFLARLDFRLSALNAALSQDAFSLANTAEALNGIAEDAASFAVRENRPGRVGRLKDEARTGIALELAAARLLATCAAPVMPRFAARLAAALGGPAPAEWPRTIPLVAPGTPIDLADQVFFGGLLDPAPLLPWLSDVVRDLLRLPPEEPVLDKTFAELGMSPAQTAALYERICEQVGAYISIDDLSDCLDLAGLSTLLASLMEMESGVSADAQPVQA